ncbi:unnamed protein product [Diabrotica balteata]|uniref:Uncharacterized protein n=1 Tax=Diabrotica balteata TaxID=107213 RepID=A0A9N9TB04_DIABA|nr:unnamed protein product [Diabrotica balteata]
MKYFICVAVAILAVSCAEGGLLAGPTILSAPIGPIAKVGIVSPVPAAVSIGSPLGISPLGLGGPLRLASPIGLGAVRIASPIGVPAIGIPSVGVPIGLGKVW